MPGTGSNPLASILWRVVACCALGAAATLAVAWRSAWRNDWANSDLVTTMDETATPNTMCRVVEIRSDGATRRSRHYWNWLESTATTDAVPELEYAWFTSDPSRPQRSFRLPRPAWPDWGRPPSDPSQSKPQLDSSAEDARGWPFRAVWCEISTDGPRAYTVRGGFELPQQSTRPDALTYRALPYRPVWPGLAADAAVFALPLYFAWSFARLARAHRRVTRGLCPRCAYDLRADLRPGCPECGWHRAAPTAQ